MSNILRKNKQPELTTAMRAEMLADLDAESREHERQAHEFAKKELARLATGQDVQIESEEVAREA